MKNFKKLNNQGIAHIGLILIALIVIGVIGVAGWRVLGKKQDEKSVNDGSGQKTSQVNTASTDITWMWGGDKWLAKNGEAPQCNKPITFTTQPVEKKLVQSILYPGQKRGGNYKPHGGFRLNSPSNNVEVKAIMDGDVVSGARYIEMGEVQYMFTIENDCGIAYRYDHLLELSPQLKEIASKLPEPKANDSRTTRIDKPIKIKAGDVVATAVGFKKNSNVSFDLGVYDYRQQNDAAKNGKLNNVNLPDLSQAGYALCWLDMFEGVDYSTLPAGDYQAGKTSDYCN